MKRVFALLFAFIMLLSLSACGGRKTPNGVVIPEDDGIVDNIIIDGEEVSAVDFVIESVNKYIASEQYKEANGFFVETFGEAIPLTVTRVIDLKAYGLSQCKMNVQSSHQNRVQLGRRRKRRYLLKRQSSSCCGL